MAAIRPRSSKEIPAYVDEYIGVVKKLARAKKKKWRLDAWDTIMGALEEESEYMREGGPCSVRIYERLVELALEHLKVHPNIANTAELHVVIESDVQVLGMHMLLMKQMTELEKCTDPYTLAESQMLDVALQHLIFQAKLLDKQLTDTSS